MTSARPAAGRAKAFRSAAGNSGAAWLALAFDRALNALCSGAFVGAYGERGSEPDDITGLRDCNEARASARMSFSVRVVVSANRRS